MKPNENGVKKIEKEIQEWEVKVLTLESGRQAAEHAKVKAEAERVAVVLLAKTGDKKAQAGLQELTDIWLRATREGDDYQIAIKQAGEHLIDLKKARRAAEKRALEMEMNDHAGELIRLFPEIEKQTVSLMESLARAMEVAVPMAQLANKLELSASPYLKVRSLLSAFVAWRLAPFNFPEISRPQHAYRKPLVELRAQFLKRYLTEPTEVKETEEVVA